jgi:hypothetical protein
LFRAAPILINNSPEFHTLEESVPRKFAPTVARKM